MRAQWVVTRRITAAAAPLMLAAVLMGFGPGVVSAAGGLRGWAQAPDQGSTARALRGAPAGSLCRDCFVVQHWDGTAWRPQVLSININPRIGYWLSGVAATSSRNAWAVGGDTTDFGGNPLDHTWIEHWDGTAWTRQASPDPGPIGDHRLLSGVAATSPTNAWAVGEYYDMANTCCAGPGHTVIVHWDGRTWAHVPAPNPGGPVRDNSLSAVAAASPDNAWAVGTSGWPVESGRSGADTLIEHWDGTAWTRVPSPNPSSESYLYNVAAASPTNAWAVGLFVDTNRGGSAKTLIVHWDGTAWTRIPSPNPGTASALDGVAATSPTDAWAVGGRFYTNRDGSSSEKTLIEHWDGIAWTRIPSPSPGSSSGLGAVAATSATNAWAVGSSSGKTLIEHWDGTAWTRVPSQNSPLTSVAATSPTNAWAVGLGQQH